MKKIVSFILITTGFLFCLHKAYAAEQETCYSCHNRETPVIVSIWTSSAHAMVQVDCVECHGEEYKADHTSYHNKTVVEAHVCARCHDKAAKEHFAGKHKIENRCDSCHSSHSTDLSIVQNPDICKTCHMGPDHPQYEMWESSKHGILFRQKGRKYYPDCTTCHMSKGTHNVSEGITMGLAGQVYPQDVRERERERMLEICSRCHAKSFAAQNLSDGDVIQRQSKALVDEADNIIRELEQEGLLLPSPADRPAHPLSGNKLELGPQMLYEDLSRVEALFFRMIKFYYVITYKGVFHQNPDYAHWYGNAPLKLTLSEIRSEAALLKELKRLRDRIDNLSQSGLSGANVEPAKEKDSLKTDLRKLK